MVEVGLQRAASLLHRLPYEAEIPFDVSIEGKNRCDRLAQGLTPHAPIIGASRSAGKAAG